MLTHTDPTDAELAEMRLARIKSLEAQIAANEAQYRQMVLEIERLRTKFNEIVRAVKKLGKMTK